MSGRGELRHAPASRQTRFHTASTTNGRLAGHSRQIASVLRRLNERPLPSSAIAGLSVRIWVQATVLQSDVGRRKWAQRGTRGHTGRSPLSLPSNVSRPAATSVPNLRSSVRGLVWVSCEITRLDKPDTSVSRDLRHRHVPRGELSRSAAFNRAVVKDGHETRDQRHPAEVCARACRRTHHRAVSRAQSSQSRCCAHPLSKLIHLARLRRPYRTLPRIASHLPQTGSS